MILYACTIFVSAFLLFQVQPVIAKIVLPWFGGSAAVWTTCMLFFQTALLVGYLYSHWTASRLPARAQTPLHLTLLLLSLLMLPVVPGDGWKPTGYENPTLRILLLLVVTVGLPYLLLAATGPLVQAWYVRAFSGASPYRLFALSNAGSMIALLGYPALVEPLLPTRRQAYAWSGAYVLFVLLCGCCAWRSRKLESADGRIAAAHGPRPSPRYWLLWIGFSACASTLLLSVTTYLTQDVAPIPFLWVLPLSIYLLSFILTFDSAGWYHRTTYLVLTGAALGAMTYSLTRETGLAVWTKVTVFGVSLFICCMTCHGEVAMLKPHPRYLTSFYLMISLGGALGGVFAGVIAPYWFPQYYELPVGIVVCAFLVMVVHWPHSGWAGAVTCTAAMAIAVTLAMHMQKSTAVYRVVARNFYGGLRTADYGTPNGPGWTRKLTHGVINHGEQYLDPQRRREATSYFGPGTGAARAILSKDRDKPQRIGITGLGAGVMLTYARPGDYYRIYEINPLVIEVAKKEFTFITDCPGKLDLVVGDARLSMEREEPQNFDVLHMDAFSSDSVPVHLLTKEAFELYFRHLKPDGILVTHISNRYLNLEPVIARAAETLGKASILVVDPSDEDLGFFGTDMVLVTNRKQDLEKPTFARFRPPRTNPRVKLWTDDYSNLFRIIK
ncbi:MAG TPA: spermidine synthase [Bryobacteraceae bacterium]|nr:spermidine synthase [Bryobacteraceae bacterium]